jgi:hypothetical protein
MGYGDHGDHARRSGFSSWDSTNLVLNWTTNDSHRYVVHYLRWRVRTFRESHRLDHGTATGNRAVTGVGFRPNLVIHAHGGFSQTTASLTAAGGTFGLGVMDGDGDQWANGFRAEPWGRSRRRHQVRQAHLGLDDQLRRGLRQHG